MESKKISDEEIRQFAISIAAQFKPTSTKALISWAKDIEDYIKSELN